MHTCSPKDSVKLDGMPETSILLRLFLRCHWRARRGKPTTLAFLFSPPPPLVVISNPLPILFPFTTATLTPILLHPYSLHSPTAPLASTPLSNMLFSNTDNFNKCPLTSSSMESNALNVQSKFLQSRSPIMVVNSDCCRDVARREMFSMATFWALLAEERDLDLRRWLF